MEHFRKKNTDVSNILNILEAPSILLPSDKNWQGFLDRIFSHGSQFIPITPT